MRWLFLGLGSLQRGEGWGSLGGAGESGRVGPTLSVVSSQNITEDGGRTIHVGRGRGGQHEETARERQRWRGELSSKKSKPKQRIDVETVGLMMLCCLPAAGWRSLFLRSNVPQSQSRALLAGRGLRQSLFCAVGRSQNRFLRAKPFRTSAMCSIWFLARVVVRHGYPAYVQTLITSLILLYILGITSLMRFIIHPRGAE